MLLLPALITQVIFNSASFVALTVSVCSLRDVEEFPEGSLFVHLAQTKTLFLNFLNHFNANIIFLYVKQEILIKENIICSQKHKKI